jgi:hypothetical protein
MMLILKKIGIEHKSPSPDGRENPVIAEERSNDRFGMTAGLAPDCHVPRNELMLDFIGIVANVRHLCFFEINSKGF